MSKKNTIIFPHNFSKLNLIKVTFLIILKVNIPLDIFYDLFGRYYDILKFIKWFDKRFLLNSMNILQH